MRRLLFPTAVATIACVLAACGSSDSAVTTSTKPAPPAGSTGGATVGVIKVVGIGSVLFNSTGKALYSPDEEASGTVLCVDQSTTLWIPLAPGASTPTAAAGAPPVAVIDRPDGTKQVTAAGRPLYTFAPDGPGKVTGDGVVDAFGTQHFTWHAILSDGTLAPTPKVSIPAKPAGDADA